LRYFSFKLGSASIRSERYPRIVQPGLRWSLKDLAGRDSGMDTAANLKPARRSLPARVRRT
jgi:hypothetical protein